MYYPDITQYRFSKWIEETIEQRPTNPLENWRYKTAIEILHESPFYPEKAEAFIFMVKCGFDFHLYSSIHE